MKPSFLLSCLLIPVVIGCAGQSGETVAPTDSATLEVLTEGVWEGGLVPMNHPDQTTPLTFSVAYQAESLTMTLGGPDGMEVPIRNAALDGDTLRFEFNEPEVGVLLTCALAGKPAVGFEGRCSDASGKWALVSMRPPAGN